MSGRRPTRKEIEKEIEETQQKIFQMDEELKKAIRLADKPRIKEIARGLTNLTNYMGFLKRNLNR